jgi:hypothetical protein
MQFRIELSALLIKGMNFIEAISSHPHLKGGHDDKGLVASKISYSYPDSATPNYLQT